MIPTVIASSSPTRQQLTVLVPADHYHILTPIRDRLVTFRHEVTVMAVLAHRHPEGRGGLPTDL
ncbi:MAG: hypothetical protein QGG53_24350 [Planctomycetota bacterium]|nr:hypothetical protein [Planctomycetota bacterium]